jgi:hypothetical protein
VAEPLLAEEAGRAATSPSPQVTLDVYGLRASVGGDWPEVVENLVRDFAWFQSPSRAGPSAIQVVIRRGPPDFDAFGDLPAAFVTPRNVVYQNADTTVVDYFGRAVSLLDRQRAHIVVQGEDANLVHEAAYHFLLSRIGEHLDARGLVRLHALGLSGPAGAVAVMLPSGGGKSTLALRALRDPDCRLLSEDSPLIDRRGVARPFPLRIGINETDAALLPEGQTRRLERMEFHPKLALEVEAFADRIEPEARPIRHLVIGCRTLGRSARLEPLPRRSAVGPLLREAVVGVGIYQGMEFVLQRGLRDVTGKVGTAATRSVCATAVLARARLWRLWVGRDQDRNWTVLRGLLDS